jgi:hypothetical protein
MGLVDAMGAVVKREEGDRQGGRFVDDVVARSILCQSSQEWTGWRARSM